MNFPPFAPLLFALTLLFAGCATTPTAPPESAAPPPPAQPATMKPARPAAKPPVKPQKAVQKKPSPPEGVATILRLLPPALGDAQGWASEIDTAFRSLKIAGSQENYCSVIAIVEQESGFQSDPVVPGLPAIVWSEIEKRRRQYGILQLAVNAALSKTSPSGISYRRRIDSLKTESELSLLYEDMISEIPFGKKFLGGKNPVRTGGPMQVSVEFAESHSLKTRYPYLPADSLRHEVFSRRGGLYFGIADLLDYPAPYSEPIYRFADFNAGRFSSRNAAFQSAVATLSGIRLSLDGDLLSHDDAAAGETEQALLSLAPRLGMSIEAIRRDLALEKSPQFDQSLLYRSVFRLAGESLPRAILPKIELKSPKIHRHLTTEWFANRVLMRYRKCLKRESPLPIPQTGG